jgi:hypothetical protein
MKYQRILLALLGLPIAAFAAESAPEPQAFTFGGDLRLRDEYFDNGLSLNNTSTLHEQNAIRVRARLWTSYKPTSDLSFSGRFAAEPRNWTNAAFTGPLKGQEGTEWRYGLIDNLNMKWGNAMGQPLTLTLGRQDIMLGDPGDWWLVMDGTPNDGSWTTYFDAVRFTYDAKAAATKFDLIYLYQKASPNDGIPTLGNPDPDAYSLSNQNEQGVILYASNKSVEGIQLDAYYIYKQDKPATDPMIKGGDDAEIHTVGGKITGGSGEHFKYSLEGAYQFGRKNDKIGEVTATRDIDAFGGKAKIEWNVKDSLNQQFAFHAEYLSGDKASTADDEMFDSLWGRWPRWSELYIYTTVMETGGRIAQLNNILHFGPSYSFSPIKGMTASLMYQLLYAPEANPSRALNGALFSKNDHFRGQYLQAVIKHKFNANVSAHLWAECVWQGDFYTRSDVMKFFRAEVMFSF